MTAVPTAVPPSVAERRTGLVSVVIVNYNTGALLTECVRSVLASTLPVEVIVSDNGSTDGSIAVLRDALGADPRVRILENGANLGFSRANNVAVPYARGDYLLFLNPDSIVQPDALERVRAVMEAHPEAGMAGCLIRNPDGSEQPGCRRYIPTPWRSLMRLTNLSRVSDNPRFSSFVLAGQPLPPAPVPVEAISGAFMLVRRSAMEKVGLLDEQYFLHCEDLDWCMRFTRAGYSILFVPDCHIVHVKGGSSTARPLRVEWHKHKGMIRFYRKFFRDDYPAPLMYLVIVAVWGRFAALAAAQLVKRALRFGARPQPPSPHVFAAGPSRIGAGEHAVIVTGASSQIGHFLLPRLREAGYVVHAVSREPRISRAGLVWHEMDIVRQPDAIAVLKGAKVLIHLAPLSTLPPMLDTLVRMGVKRIIAFGSTSRYTKLASNDPAEKAFARGLIRAEDALADTCEPAGIAWTLFRPTLIYGCGLDKNVTVIAKFIRWFGFFPILGEAKGMRQPVHADDLAAACVRVIDDPVTFNKAYNLSGGERLSYRDMVTRIFERLGRRPSFVRIPRGVFAALIALASVLPPYRHVKLEMVNRINVDLDYDHDEATRDFGYAPRGFEFPAPEAQATNGVAFDAGRRR